MRLSLTSWDYESAIGQPQLYRQRSPISGGNVSIRLGLYPMKKILFLCVLLGSVLITCAAEEPGSVQYFKKAIIFPGFPRPSEPLKAVEVEAIKKGEERRYAYVEAYYSAAGLLEKLQKVFKGKILWKYEFMYADAELIRIMEYDSKGKALVWYDFRNGKIGK